MCCVEHADHHVGLCNAKSLQRHLFTLSDDVIAAIIASSDAPGMLFNLLLVNKHIFCLLRDESWPTWRGLAHRMSTWAPSLESDTKAKVSSLVSLMLTRAAARIGGWRALCFEKESYDPRHLSLPADAPIDWPPGRWYLLLLSAALS